MLESINFNQLPGFLLVFIRVTSFFVTLPVFSYRNVPTRHKVGFSFFLALIMYFTIPMPEISVDSNYMMLLFKEAAVGIAVGLLAYIILGAIQIAGGFIDFQMGFAIANVIDPQTGAQSPLIGQYLYMITLLFILAVNGHHLMIDGVFYSYELIPIDQFLPLQDEGMDLLYHRFLQSNVCHRVFDGDSNCWLFVPGRYRSRNHCPNGSSAECFRCRTTSENIRRFVRSCYCDGLLCHVDPKFIRNHADNDAWVHADPWRLMLWSF